MSSASNQRRSVHYLTLFAVLIALRDVTKELGLSEEDSISFAFAVTGVIAVLALVVVLAKPGGIKPCTIRLRNPRVAGAAAILGVSAALIYVVTFAMIDEMGAGLFNLIDYGAAPILTAGIGVVAFRNKAPRWLLLSFAMYVSGIALLHFERHDVNVLLVLIALCSPIATAASDGLTAWMLSPDGGGLSRSELLLVRFTPASLGILGFTAVTRHDLSLVNPPVVLGTATVLGFVPMWLLCSGLIVGKKNLVELAVAEYLIPVLAFVLTLPARADEHFAPVPIVGALLVLVALTLGNDDLRRASRRTTQAMWKRKGVLIPMPNRRRPTQPGCVSKGLPQNESENQVLSTEQAAQQNLVKGDLDARA